jgi:hypothetical protein
MRRHDPDGIIVADGMTWRPGMFVSFRPLGQSFGPRLDPIEGRSLIFTILDLDIDQAQDIFLAQHINDDDFANFQRVVTIDFALLPEGVLHSLEITGRADVTMADLRYAARDALFGTAWF